VLQQVLWLQLLPQLAFKHTAHWLTDKQQAAWLQVLPCYYTAATPCKTLAVYGTHDK
jgi:hypothetical protein